jgi:hypothetical protein
MASSFGGVITLMVVTTVLPIFISVGLKARSFPEGAIVVYPVLFFTLERGWLKCDKPY